MEEESFEQYIERYKKMPLTEKQDIAIKQLKMLASLANKMCEEINAKNEILISRELLDVNKEKYTEDDYSEALIVLINSIQNSLCDFNIKLTELLKKQKIDLE